MIDHVYQLRIVKKLALSEGAMKFSRLNEDNLENSLFNFHVKKLTMRDIIEKTEDGYKLTVKGARFANEFGVDDLKPKLFPKTLINLLIKKNDHFLIVRRRGAAKEILNPYLLPGGNVPRGSSVYASKEELIAKNNIHEKVIKTNDIGFIEVIDGKDDLYHALIYICFIELSDCDFSIFNEERYQSEWLTKEEILKQASSDKSFISIFNYALENKDTAKSPLFTINIDN